MKNVKQLFWWMLNAVLLMTIIVGIFAVRYLDRSSASMTIARTIVVEGVGKVKVVPDVADLTFAVTTEGTELETIQDQNATSIQEGIDLIKSQGIDEKDIKTFGYNLSPKYTYNEKKKQSYIDGYTLTQSVSVHVRDIKKVSIILGGLPALGINQINGVNFSAENPDIVLNQARESAFKKARAKAESMAKQNEVSLGRIVTFSEYQGGGYATRFYGADAMGGKGGEVALPPIEPGSEELTVNVSVTYELR